MKIIKYEPDDFSKEIPNEMYGVLHAEIRTGIITDIHGKRILGPNIKYLLFPTLDSARSYCQQFVVSAPELECSIYDSKKNVVETQKNNEYIKQIMGNVAASKKKWWKIWK